MNFIIHFQSIHFRIAIFKSQTVACCSRHALFCVLCFVVARSQCENCQCKINNCLFHFLLVVFSFAMTVNGFGLCEGGDFYHKCSYKAHTSNLRKTVLRSTKPPLLPSCCSGSAFSSVVSVYYNTKKFLVRKQETFEIIFDLIYGFTKV